jgi:hypothetical protein
VGAPKTLGPAGKELWLGLSAGRNPDPAASVLLLTAAEIADDLARLRGILRRKDNAWISLAEEADDLGHVAIVVDGALAQYRSHALALRTIIAQLGLGRIGDVKAKGVSALDALADEVAAAREKRNSGAAGAAHPDRAGGA